MSMSLTEVIEQYIQSLFADSEREQDQDRVSLRRKDVAERFGCVPSQINYVIRSRFTPERGFLVESQRGGNGYIRILKISYEQPEEKQRYVEDIVGDSLTEQDAKRLLTLFQQRGLITPRERLIVEISLRHLSDLADGAFDISPFRRDAMRAELAKRVFRGLIYAS
ncbi:transcriptional regulator CtsR [Jonquetella sp. BV3C21]|uniref:Transcriptional repressor of class III stress genes n=2 Tax=Dethiosulfovibrionaceae TaxID=3029088 RepID=H0UJM5_9BACT|nr:transcriptional repressor of class III stress genes [Jonquetella anthropi DSM 22815]ERL24014.1 transcriptional regulator CtsR [Jonquetella sp. BV3C21]